MKTTAEKFLKTCNFKENEVEYRFKGGSNTAIGIIKYYFQDLGWKYSTSESVVSIGSLKGDTDLPKDVRHIHEGGKDTFMNKSQVRPAHFDNDFKISESKEADLKMTKAIFAKLYNVILIRERKRITLTYGGLQIDMTTVNELNVSSGEKRLGHEIELEVKSLKDSIQNIFTTVDTIKRMMNSKFITLTAYKNMVKQHKFAGPLPFTLIREKFDEGVLSCGYSVTDKADGERFHLMIDGNGHAFTIDRSFNDVTYVGRTGAKNTILDGELIGKVYHAFDILFKDGKDLRQLFLIDRLTEMGNVVKSADVSKMTITLKCKSFYYKNDDIFYRIINGNTISHKMDSNGHIGNVSNEIWKRRKEIFKYELDGLIFTPLLKGYMNSDIYKWKPTDTVDLYIEKISPTKWKLFIAGMSDQGSNNYAHIPFSGIDGKGTFIVKKGRNEEKVENLIFKDTSVSSDVRNGIITVTKPMSAKFKDKCVVEFKFNKTKGTFVPMMQRVDKVFANGIPTMNDIWNSLKNPITITNIKASKFRSCIRPFHNEIKKMLIKKYTRGARVLDIGFGAGGDIHKYMQAGTRKVVGIDIVDNKYPLPANMDFVKVTGDLYNVRETLSKKNLITSFDIVNVQFAAHYFFRNREVLENFITNVNNVLVKNGTIILTMLDGNKVNALMQKKKRKIGKCGKQHIYELKKTDTVKKNIGQQLQVKLSGTAYFDEPSNEYLVDIDGFLQHMKGNGFIVVKNESFSTYETQLRSHTKIMCEAEKEYSYLNNVIVLKKIN